MKKYKKILYHCIHLKALPLIVVTLFSTLFLIWGFVCLDENNPLRYISYLLSAYALFVLIFNIIPLFKKGKSALMKNTYASRYINDIEWRVQISMLTSFFINLAYAVFKLIMSVWYQSWWLGAVAVYYMVLCVIRLIILKDDRIARRHTSADQLLRHQLKSYRTCGIALLLLNIAMNGMIIQMIYQDKSYVYSGMLIYIMAAYTFYRFVIAIINIFKYRKTHNPVYSAAKALDLTVAVMSLFALQTAMLTEFGDDLANKQIMNISTGVGVECFVLCVAVFMIVRANTQLKKLKAT